MKIEGDGHESRVTFKLREMDPHIRKKLEKWYPGIMDDDNKRFEALYVYEGLAATIVMVAVRSLGRDEYDRIQVARLFTFGAGGTVEISIDEDFRLKED